MQLSIKDLTRLDSGVVTKIHWCVTVAHLTEEGVLDLRAPNPDNFIPFESLSATQAHIWLSKSGMPHVVRSIERLQSQLQDTPETLSGLPWQ